MVVACIITPSGKETRTFGTITADLIVLAEWLQAIGRTHVAMESTGVYWEPIYNLLEATGLQLLVVNAEFIKTVPGRKTDAKDSEWIASPRTASQQYRDCARRALSGEQAERALTLLASLRELPRVDELAASLVPE